jgi:hypothetical protein
LLALVERGGRRLLDALLFLLVLAKSFLIAVGARAAPHGQQPERGE